MFDRLLSQLAFDIEAGGLAAVENDIATIVSAARATGASTVLIDVLADRTAPEVARARAFGRLAQHLSRHLSSGPVPVEQPLATAGATS